MKVVHIGFPKTATTFLQQKVFPRFGKGCEFFDTEESSTFFAPLINYDDTIFDLEALKAKLERACCDRRNVLFSYEPLTGLHYKSAFVNRTLIAKRLKALGFDRAIITIRNQFDALEATYKQYIKSGGVLKFDAYINFGSSESRYFYPEYFDYYPLYCLYAELFGPSNVLVLQYENLRKKSFIDDICRFLEVGPLVIEIDESINPSLSYYKTRILRLINHFTYNSFRPSHLVSRKISTQFFFRCLSRMPCWDSRKSFLSPPKRNVVASFYRQSNQRLQDEVGITLGPDYPMPPGEDVVL